MTDPVQTPTDRPETRARGAERTGRGAVVEETLVEEVSIDGMCGVYYDARRTAVDAGPASPVRPGVRSGRPYRCSPSVALRPEPFGALAYHFGTRRLVVPEDPELVDVVSGLAEHPDVHAALDAGGRRARAAYPRYLRALAGAGRERTPSNLILG